MQKNILIIGILIFLTACVKDKPENKNGDNDLSDIHSRVLIVNEGSLGLGNASLSIFDKNDYKMHNQVFQRTNDLHMGDIFQSAYQIEDEIFLLINNSHEILVINAKDYKFKKRIPVRSPRNMLQINADLAYVTSLFHDQIYILNIDSKQVVDSIQVSYKNTENLLKFNDYVYVCNWNKESEFIYKINTQTHQIEENIPLGVKASHGIIQDKNENLWIFSGQPSKNIPSAITIYNPYTKTIENQKIFPGVSERMKPITTPNRDTIYFLSVNYDGDTQFNGVFYSLVNSEEIKEELFLAAEPYQYYWGLAYDNKENHIYIADPRGFIQQGRISIYNTNKELIHESSVGIGPGNFLFLEEN